MSRRPLVAAATAGLAALALAGCLTSPAGHRSDGLPSSDWAYRLVGESESDPDPAEYRYLDSAGRLRLKCRYWFRDGRCETGTYFHYDSMGSWTHSEQWLDGNPTGGPRPMRYEYGDGGRIRYRSEFSPGKVQPAFISEYQYDLSGRLSAVVRYESSLGGERDWEKRFSYDSLGRPDTVWTLSGGQATTDPVETFTYDAEGRLEEHRRMGGYTTRYERDAGGRIHRILQFFSHSPDPSVYRVQYRDESVRIAFNPLDAVFWDGPFTP